jgi:hypothetical protein
MTEIATAGSRTELARPKVVIEKSAANIEPYEAKRTPTAIAIPPKYGTGSV